MKSKIIGDKFRNAHKDAAIDEGGERKWGKDLMMMLTEVCQIELNSNKEGEERGKKSVNLDYEIINRGFGFIRKVEKFQFVNKKKKIKDHALIDSSIYWACG